jgi:uncharacterized protein YbgA (DUF1722 family)
LKIKDNEEQVSLSSKVHMVEEGSSSKKPFQKKKQKKRMNFQKRNSLVIIAVSQATLRKIAVFLKRKSKLLTPKSLWL